MYECKGSDGFESVFVEGFKVGLVREIVYDYDAVDKISIDISLEDHMKINKGSYITIVNSFLGGGELHIHLNKYVDDYLKPGDTIEGRMESDMMQSVQERFSRRWNCSCRRSIRFWAVCKRW